MSEAALAAQRAEDAALNARCAASPREAALFAATLRRTPHAQKVTRLINSAIFDNAALARLQLADGLSPNTIHRGQSLLFTAACHGSIDVVRLLLEAGADANSCDSWGNTALVEAVGRGQLACARELILHGPAHLQRLWE